MFVTQYYFCQSQKIEAGDTPAPHRDQDEKREHHQCGTPVFLFNHFSSIDVDLVLQTSDALGQHLKVALGQTFKQTAVGLKHLEIVVVELGHNEAVEVCKVREAMLHQSLAKLFAHGSFFGNADLLERAYVEIVARDSGFLGVKLFTLFSAVLGIVNQILVHMPNIDNWLDGVHRPLAFGRELLEHLQSMIVRRRIWEDQNQMHVVFSML